MALDRDQIDKHISILEEFEQKYGEFLVAENDRRVEGMSAWSSRQWSERVRELRRLAPRADAAIDTSGVGGLAVYWPPALGGGLKADDLTSLIFEVRPSAFGTEEPDHELRQQILDRLPGQIEGLKMRREETDEPKRRKKVRPDRSAWWHEPNPWVLGISVGLFVTIVGGIAVALIVSG